MGGFPDEFRVCPGITVTRTKISRTTGVLDQTTESHPLTGVHASVTEFGGQYSHRTFSRSAGGAVVGGLVGAPLLGAVVAPHKKVDNRNLQVTITGPGFCWTYSTGTTFTPHGKVAELNDRAAKYTAEPDLVEKQQALRAAERALRKTEQRQASADARDAADQKILDRYAEKIAAARAAGKTGKVERLEATTASIRAKMAKRQARTT